ncbi:MAG TPA: S41 family peptidase, partial [Thermoanaerobaculia bacterium]|nr:S41 family peptidase [Thermoanaerobaculia bacterium]
RAAVQGMLDALGDPMTKVLEPPTTEPEKPAPEGLSLFRKLDDGIFVIDLGRYPQSVDRFKLFTAVEALRGELSGATAVVIDMRSEPGMGQFWAEIALHELEGALVPRPCQAPAQRYLMHSGYRPQIGGGSGGYWSGFVTQFADSFQPDSGRTGGPKRVVFLLDSGSEVSTLALALQATGDARFVVEGKLEERSRVIHRRIDLGEGIMAAVRVSELVPFPGWRGLRADVEVPEGAGSAALDAAIAEARKEWPALDPGIPGGAGAPQPLPEAVFRPDRNYSDMAEPSLEYRQLAVVRAWNVIHRFYPYLHLIGDWDAVLPEFLARMEEAKTGRDYALMLMEMMTHVPDGHTGLWGRPEVLTPFGDTGLPIQVRWVEGAPVAIQVSDEVREAGIEVGDAILAVDGEPVDARIERFRRYATASTPAHLLNRIAGRFLLVGDAGSTAVLKIEKLDGSTREVSLVRDPKKQPPQPEKKGEVVRILPGNWGYVDLTRLTVPEVDALFEKVAGTRGLIMDMRGYPQGTAWSIAPYINTKKAKIGAQFRRSQVSAFSGEEGESGFYFSQPLPDLPEGESLYTAPTVMLIDDRAISQSEHSGLFYEAASGTKFIGSPSAGANGDVTRFGVPGGIWIGFTGHDVRHADGRQLQRIGLIPDVEVAPTRAGLKAGRDEVLERAVQYLEETARP